MDEEYKIEYKLPSILEISEIIDRVQSPSYPLSFNLEKLNSINGIVSQYDNFNPAASIVSKAIQPADFFPTSVVDHISTAMTVQDNFLEMIKRVSVYDNSLMSVRDDLIQHIERVNIHSNMISSVNVIRSSLEPHISALGAVSTSFEASESLKRARGLQSYIDSSNSLLSEYTGVFKHFESFKALSRLENFPSDVELDKVSAKALDEPQTMLAEVKRLDEKINQEVRTVDDFNELSEETKRDSNLFLKYYYGLVINLVVALCLLEDSLGKDLDLSRKSFKIADNVGEVIVDIGHYWNGNKVALFNGFIVTQINKFVSLIVS